MHDDQRFSFDKVHKLDNAERHQVQPAGPIVDHIASLHPGVVLDLGAGTGYYALPLAERLPDARIVALDVEPRMLEHLRERAEGAGLSQRIELVVAEVEEADASSVAPGTVDVALMSNLYHELDDRRAGLDAVRNLLKEGGTLLVCDWDPDAQSDVGPPRDHRVRPEVVEGELTAAGFTAVIRRALHSDVYSIVAIK